MKRGLRILSILFCSALLSWAWVAAPPALTRGPYLQSAAAAGITLVCKTSTVAAVTLRYGEQVGPPWTGEATSAASTTHVFTLTGLRPETRYAYELLSGGSPLAGGADCSFLTSPPEESRAPFRFLAWGDSGTGSSTQLEVASWMVKVQPAATFALGLGDLVYDSGEWENYDPRLFQPYARLLRSTTFWPALGNHDAQTENGAPYLDAFYVPTQSGAPGHPSNSERYYSFDHGMAHFACVDSESSSNSPGSAQYTWLEDDLAHARARGKRWLFVYMHHPPYTRGTHDSTSEPQLIDLRVNLVPLFERSGVDLVMTGHSHVYERSYLAKNDAVLQSNPSEYTKIGSPDGTVYLVTGCGGKTGSGPLDHPLMARSFGNVAGFNTIDVSWSEVRGRFLERDGRTTDLFTVRKAADTTPPRVAEVAARATNQLALVFDEPVQAGAGAAGAENPGHYALDASAAVLSATLDSDQSTVLLATTPLTVNRSYTLDVQGVSDPGGRSADEHVRFVVPGAGPGAAPVAVLGAPVRTANAPARLFFSAAGSEDGDGPLAALSWDFGDGSPRASGIEVEHLYTAAGTHTVTLVVRDSDGREALAQATIRIHVQGDAPRAELAAGATQVSPGGSVSFDSAGSLDPDGGAVTLHWTFGDPGSGPNDVSNLAAPSHTYANVGYYTATLVVTDDEGSSASQMATIQVGSGIAPTALFTASATPGDPLRIAFEDRSSGNINAWAWDFGDGGSSTQSDPEHRYAVAGDYTVRLVVTDPSGSDEYESVVSVVSGGGVTDGGGGGGGCSIDPQRPSRGDPLLAAILALALLGLARRRGEGLHVRARA